ncbi:MAG: DUF3219 family protein [Alkalicoccus sp.]|nr:MAG: DUF3219 family protein [Alkalicoccus sp.]
MTSEIRLNGAVIPVEHVLHEQEDGKHRISVTFLVTHEEYHRITTLLYEGMFDVEIPEKSLSFIGVIANYSTSITNLYEAGQTGEFYLQLTETDK